MVNLHNANLVNEYVAFESASKKGLPGEKIASDFSNPDEIGHMRRRF
jgi:hypothetical protein